MLQLCGPMSSGATGSIYGEYGISVFAARDATVDELAQEVPLARFETPTLVRVGDLRA